MREIIFASASTVNFKRKLPSVNALLTLESAVRLKSFTAAARELNVTQAAVSRQIRMLEEDFGIPLFHRMHRRVEPTPSGAALGAALYDALCMMGDAVEVLRQPHSARILTVGATLAFSYFWLLPRLADFRERHPELKIRVVSQDEPFDLRSGDLDVVMRFGVPPFEDGRTVASKGDKFFPVSSSDFASRFQQPPSPVELMALPLIGSDVPDPSWMHWSDWFKRAGLPQRPPRPAIQFNHYTDTIAAALAGQGIALGWNLIVGDLLAAGQLVCLGEKMDAGGAYNAVIPQRRPPNQAAEAFAEWISSAFAKEDIRDASLR